VFEEAEQVVVITRFFRETGEPAWRVDFSSIEKPFFTEPTDAPVGTEILISLKEPLAREKLAELAESFFLYVPEGVKFTPAVRLPTSLDDVPFFSLGVSSERHVLIEGFENAVLGRYAFRMRSCFAFRFENDPPKPGAAVSTAFSSRLVVANGGVRVFDQTSEYLKPGRRYVIGVVDESGLERYGDAPNRLSAFHVIVDFDPQNSPVLPSRFEIDIDAEFSEALKAKLYSLFSTALTNAVEAIVKAADFNKRLRERLLLVLFSSYSRAITYGRRRSRNVSAFQESDAIEKTVISLYRKHCPVLVGERDGERLAHWDEIRNTAGRLLVLEEVAKTDLFAAYVRKRNIQNWILAKTAYEFATLLSLIDNEGVALFSSVSLYDERDTFLDEDTQSPISKAIRGDYAVIRSTIFGTACFLRLPGSLKGLWKKDEAAARSRNDVANVCPARVLLNAAHPLVKAVDSFLGQNANDLNRLREMRLLLDNFGDGVIEKDSRSGAKAGWNRIRSELARVTGSETISAMSYEELRPRNIY
jgi:hypothetical protein